MFNHPDRDPQPDHNPIADAAATAIWNNQDLGLIGWLAMIGVSHQRMSTSSFMSAFKYALQQGQLEILERRGKPVAWMIWRRPKKEQWRDLLLPHGIELNMLDEPLDRIWLDFWIRPFGCDRELARVVSRRISQPPNTLTRFCWHDPSDPAGNSRLHLDVKLNELEGK